MKDFTNYAHRKLVHDALADGLSISVHDGECWVSHLERDEDRIVLDIESVDMATINLYKAPETSDGDALFLGWAVIVLDTGPDESVADYNANSTWLNAWFDRGGNE